MSFPTSPALGTTYSAPGGQSWKFNVDGAWERVSDGATVPNAAVGLNIKPGGLVLSSDGTMMYNHTAATISITSLTRVGLLGDGLIPFYTTLSLPVNLGGTITASPLLDPANGTVLTSTLTASNGTAPTTWAVQAGALPPGLSLNSTTGVISGTPTGAGGSTYNFTIRGTDASGDFNDQTFSGTVAGHVIAGGSLAPGTVTLENNTPPTDTFVAAGGTAPYTYAVHAGTLPAGVVLNAATGALTGKPTDPATTAYTFTIRATDSLFNYVDKAYTGTIAVAAPPLTYPNKQVFNYTGADQTFAVPASATWVKIKAWGAGGGGVAVKGLSSGGAGGFSVGELNTLSGLSLTVVVGGGGAVGRNSTNGGVNPALLPSYGGGGAGGGAFRSKGGSGGGLSGVLKAPLASAVASDAVIIAGGGSGSGADATLVGANGGGLSGNTPAIPATFSPVASGPGTQIAGGAAGSYGGVQSTTPATSGALYIGGNGGGDNVQRAGAGGGGGLYGGGGGTAGSNGGRVGLSGGGGSGYIGGATNGSTVATLSGSTAVPSNTDVDYVGGTGTAATGVAGGNGLVVIEWN